MVHQCIDEDPHFQNMNIETDHVIEHRRSDIVVIVNDNKRALLIDIAVPPDARVEEKEQKKMDRY